MVGVWPARGPPRARAVRPAGGGGRGLRRNRARTSANTGADRKARSQRQTTFSGSPRVARLHRRRRELLALDDDDGHIVLAAGAIGGLDQFARGLLRIARHCRSTASRISADATWSLRPSLHSSSALSGSNGNAHDLDEIGVVGRVLFRADIAKHLVAARMAHGFGLGQLAGVLALARPANGRA